MPKTITFFPLDFTYSLEPDGNAQKPVVHIFAKTVEGTHVCILDETFAPYFYVIPKKGYDIASKLKDLKIPLDNLTILVSKVEPCQKLFQGTIVDALRVFLNIPKGVPEVQAVVREWPEVSSTHEFDILFVRRYALDKAIIPMTLSCAEGDFEQSHPLAKKYHVPVFVATSVSPLNETTLEHPKLLGVDIETYADFSKGVDFNNPILMLALYGENFKKVLVWKKFPTDKEYIEFVGSESDLLRRFAELVQEINPDILAGYFSDGFDLPYIKARADKLKIPLALGCDGSSIRMRKAVESHASINGIIHVDILKFIKKTSAASLDSYSLNNVAAAFLGEQKHDVNLENLHRIWDSAPEKLEEYCIYNLIDARLVFNLTQKMLPALIEMSKIPGLPLFDVNRMGYSQIVEWYILRQAFAFNEIAPNKPSGAGMQERTTQSIKGGFVFEPKPGLYKDIVVFDYRSLYPTIISSHNIDPGMLNCSCCPDGPAITGPDGTPYRFCQKRQGLIPQLVGNLITRRTQIKKAIKSKGEAIEPFLDAQQNSLKLLANSFYGYLGFSAARWYSKACAEAVTAFGRKYIQDVIAKARQAGFDVIYSDTDSVFLTLGNNPPDAAVTFAHEINKHLPGLMELEYEGFYPSGIFVSAKAGAFGAKKKYTLLREDGTLKIRGFEVVRRNWSAIAKETQQRIFEIILKEQNPAKALEFVKAIIADLKAKKISLDKVVIHTQLQKEIGQYASTGPHVAVAKRMKQQGLAVGPGSLISYVVTSGDDTIGNRAKLPAEVTQNDYDAEYYIHHQVIPAVDRIFAVLGYDIEDMLGQGKQGTLGKYF